MHPISAYMLHTVSAAGDTPKGVLDSTAGLVNQVILANYLSNNERK